MCTDNLDYANQYPLLRPISCIWCQGNLDSLAIKNEALIAIRHFPFALLFPFWHPSFPLHKPLPSAPLFKLGLTETRDVGLFDRNVRQRALSPISTPLHKHLSIKFGLSESAWSSWPAGTAQSEPGSTVMTSPHFVETSVSLPLH